MILDTVEDEQPGAFELATLLSCAIVVEPELIREVRLEAARRGQVAVDAATEAMVWFSPLVRTRTPTGIAFEPEAAQVLRERLRCRWQDAGERPLLDAAWQLIAARHPATSPALVLEERLAWAVVTGEPVAVLDEALGLAVAAYVQRGDEGVAWWAAQAWDRLPPLARATPSGGMVRELGDLVAAGEPLPDPDEFVGTVDLDRILGAVPRVRVGVRRMSPSAIELGDVSGPGAFAIEVPDTEVMRVAVTCAELAEPRTLEAHEGTVRAVAFSPDGRYLATGGGDESFRLWDAATSEPLSRSSRQRGAIRAVAFSRDGRIASAGDDGTIELWRQEGELLMVLEGHRGPANAVAFSGDGARLVSGGQDGSVRLWELDRLAESLEPASRAVHAVAFSPSDRQIASAEDDGTVRLWEPGGVTRTFTAHKGPVLALAFAPDGHGLATAGFDGLAIWSVESLSPLRRLPIDEGPVAAVAFSPDGRHLASAGADAGACVWDVASGGLITRFPGPRSQSVAFSPGGLLAIAGDDGSVRIWEAELGTRTEQVDLLAGQTKTVEVAPGEVQLETSLGEVFLLAETPEPPPRPREPATGGLIDLHAFYATHLTAQTDIPASPGRLGSIADWVRSGVLGLAGRLSRAPTLTGGPGVTEDLIRAGQVGAICSVLNPLNELDLSAGESEPARASDFAALLQLLDTVEADVSDRSGLVVVRSPEQLDEAFAVGWTALIHAVDGGFHVGTTPDEIAANVKVLAGRGVATAGLAQPSSTGLTEPGRAAARALVANGVIVDIAYMSDTARRDAFELLDELDPERRVPVLASHGAYRFGKLELALDDEAVRRVAERGGVIALTLAEHPLTDGLRTKTRTRNDSVEVLSAHIDRIVSIAGSWDHVAIGSDFDGFQKPTLPGLQTIADLAFLQQALAARYGRPDAQRICTGNALRLLRTGWGRKQREDD